ncbi:hypothetical protein FRB91_002103 [Serendipita sp. 411]|nr:hypothetical protein FRB91_002103 [Serendipita sp. 411]
MPGVQAPWELELQLESDADCEFYTDASDTGMYTDTEDEEMLERESQQRAKQAAEDMRTWERILEGRTDKTGLKQGHYQLTGSSDRTRRQWAQMADTPGKQQALKRKLEHDNQERKRQQTTLTMFLKDKSH